MKAFPAKALRVLTGFALIISCFACSPKCMIRGRVMDAETHQPLSGVAVAIRWLENTLEGPSAKTVTFDAVQTLSDSQGVFLIPEYPEKKFILGVDKAGYICWSSRDIFSKDADKAGTDKGRKRKSYQIKDGMQIELKPFKKEDSREQHAGFTVMVAGESTDGQYGLFHQAIESEFRLWRESLRKNFQDQFGE